MTIVFVSLTTQCLEQNAAAAAAAAAKSLQSCPTLRPHRRQPTRLPRPWDYPGKNPAVGCHFLLQCMKVKSESEVTVMSDSSRLHGLQPTRLLHPWDFPGKSPGVGCHCLLQFHRHAIGISGYSQGLLFFASSFPPSLLWVLRTWSKGI